MILKPTRKLPQTNSTLEDCIAEATAFCSSNTDSRKRSASGRLSSGSLAAKSGKNADDAKDVKRSPADRPSKPTENKASAKRSFAELAKEEKKAGLSRKEQTISSHKKGATEIRPSQLGSSASKLWNRLFPGKEEKSPGKKAKTALGDSVGTSEQQIRDRLAAISARIQARSNYVYGDSSNKVEPGGAAQASPATCKQNWPTVASSANETAGKNEAVESKTVSATQKSQLSVASSTTQSQSSAKQADTKPSQSASVPPVASKPTAGNRRNRARKNSKTSPTASSGPKLYDQASAVTPTAVNKIPLPPILFKHYTIPKRTPPSAPPSAPSPELPPAAPASLSSQPDSAAPVAVVSPFLPPTGPPAPAVPADSRQQAGTLDTELAVALAAPPPPPPPEEDEQELMELDEPDLNDEQVLSQIACLRDAATSGPVADVPWSPESATAASATAAAAVDGSCRGGETAALLAGWSPLPATPAAAVTAAAAVAAAAAAETQCSLTVVLDTNVLIHGVGFVLDLRDSFIEGRRPQLLIPWVVVEELDRLKQTNRPQTDTTVAAKARAAINFLLECFQARHPAVRGQTTAEAAAARGPLQGRVADDAILECSLAAGREGDVLLISDDKNLLTKVLLHGLTAVSRQQLLSKSDLASGIDENLPVTEENQICFTKIILRKVLSYVIRREMSLVYGAAWSALPGVRRPWWSLRDLVSVVCSHRSVFRAVFAERWSHWQQVLKLATRAVLSPVERSSLCAGLASLLPLLRPAAHYQPMLRPLAAALQTGTAPPAAPLAALGPSLGGPTTPGCSSEDPGPPGIQATTPCQTVPSEAARTPDLPTANGPSPGDLSRPDDEAERVAAGTPPPLDEVDDMICGGGPEEMEPAEVLDLFQDVWAYVNTCCGLLLDAAGVPHPYQYERPAVPPTPEECAAFLPELGTAVQTLAAALKRLMSVSVVALASQPAPLEAACGALHAVVALAGHDTALAPQPLLRFLRSPANRLLLGKGLEQLIGFLRTLEELHRMVS